MPPNFRQFELLEVFLSLRETWIDILYRKNLGSIIKATQGKDEIIVAAKFIERW